VGAAGGPPERSRAPMVDLYTDISGRINDLVIKVLDISKLFKKIYVLMAYNPGRGLWQYGSYDPCSEYVVTAVFTRRNMEVKHVLDVVIHEVIHGLLRLNSIELSEEEEELIDTLYSEGYLLRELGLSTVVRTARSRFVSAVNKYFENKLFNAASLIEYLRLNGWTRTCTQLRAQIW